MPIADLSRRSMMGVAVVAAAAPFAPAAAIRAAPASMPPSTTVRTDLLEIAYAE